MKTIGRKTLGLLVTALALTINTATAATTGELLQQGLYAEEVEGNIDSAIKAYGQVIQNSSAPANHVAQALYRQGMCYMKMKDESSARAVLEKLVAEYSSQTDLVEKARPILDDLTDFDPASLMPPGTLVYAEFGSPGRQVETILTMLKGTPFENPLTIVAGPQGNNNGQKSPGDIVGALLNPSMMAEFKKIRSSAVGITGIAQNNPPMVSVLYPGKSDALRGLILAGLGMAGKPGDAIEGMQVVNIQNFASVAYDDKVIITATPASQLEWCVRQYKHLISEPTLATSNKSFAKLSKTQRQKNVLTLWANVDEAYGQLLKMFPNGQTPAGIISANAFADFKNIDDLILTESVETNGLGYSLEFQFKDGHHCLAYDMIRTPNIGKAALEAVPAEAVAVASFSMNQAIAGQSDKVRAQIQNITGLDIGREIFANVEQVTVFAVPADGKSTNVFLPAQLGVAITSHDPDKTRQVLATLLGAVNPTASSQAGQYKISKPGQPDLYCFVNQVNGITLLSLNPVVVGASAASINNHKSVSASGPLNKSVNGLAPNTSKVLLINAGGAIRLLAPMMNPGGLSDEQAKQFNSSLDQLAHAASTTTVELRTDEQLNAFAMNSSVSGLPPLNEIIGPATQISGIIKQARAEAAAKNLQRQKPSIVMPATKSPVIDGNLDDVWNASRQYKLENVSYSPLASPADLSADYRALYDENNLYLFVDVTDDVLKHASPTDRWYESDGIEIYIDGDNAKPSEYGENDCQFAITWDKTSPTIQETKHGRTEGVQYALVTTDKGYRVEIKFPWSTLKVKPSVGATIGLDVHVNDSDVAGKRDSKLTWHDTQDDAYRNPQSFGNAELAGLVGWWKFDETQGTSATDSSGNNHNGTLAGNAKFGRGKIGGAIDLDGAGSFVRIADKSAFDIGGEVTIACWVNFRTVPAEWTGIVTKGDTAWRLSTVERERQVHFAVNDFGRGGDNIFINSPTAMNAGEWHHVAGVYDGRTINLYMDGKLDSTKPWAGGLGRNDFEVLIGENAENTNRSFNGLIDDVRIYNYALPESGIKSLAAGQ